jgi:hypothetical protein
MYWQRKGKMYWMLGCKWYNVMAKKKKMYWMLGCKW